MILLDLPPDFRPKLEVSSCFVESDGEILLLLRQDHKPEPNVYGVPAGKVHADETAEEACRRETLEETGIALVRVEYFRSVGVRYGTHDILYHMFRSRLDSRPEVVINPDEHKSYCWRTPAAALREPLMFDGDACIELAYGVGGVDGFDGK